MRHDVVAVLARGASDFLVRRTVRALAAVGVDAGAIRRVDDARGLRMALLSGARFVVRAGATVAEGPIALPASTTGRPVVAFGVPLPALTALSHTPAIVTRARSLLAASGGALEDVDAHLPFVTLSLCERALASVADLVVDDTGEPDVALLAAAARARARVVHLASLDAHYGASVRVAEIVTSLQIGGAEAIARALAQELPRVGLDARLFALGSPTRTRLPALPGELDLGGSRLDPEARVARLASELAAWGADVAHVHLFGSDVIRALAAAGWRPVVTIHNARQGFPPGTEDMGPHEAGLVVACASAVERDLRAAGVGAPIRTVANGVDASAFRAHDPTGEQRRALRAAWGVADGVTVLLVLANPRPQKRLDRVASIAAALGRSRPVHVVWAGAASERDPAAKALAASFLEALARQEVPVRALGAVVDPAPLFGGVDVLLATSDWEGLSLAQLEALAAGVPVVATDVGGTREIADAAPAGWVTLVACDAPPERVASDVGAAADLRTRALGGGDAQLPARFSRTSMIRGYARLLRAAAHVSATPRGADRLILVTNNFSPGGAQSSARRLLAALAARGRRVAAITLEEDDARPTAGLAALRGEGVEVVAALAGRAEAALDDAWARLGLTGAETFVCWNAIAEHKVLLAERAFAGRVFDVSPGEMYFTSLARYFERPRPDASVSARAYGRLLEGAIVKFEAERARASTVLGCPVHVVPNGVPIASAPRVSRRSGPFRFGTAVRIHAHKRLDLLVDAFRRVARDRRDVELHVAGAPDAGQDAVLAELRQATADLPVRWLGFRDDVAPFLATPDAFVLVAEPAGCPNASLEAMGAGLPTLATDVGGIREQLDGGAGLVVPRFDPVALAEAMERVVADPALRARLASSAHARARDRFSVDRMVDDYERLFFG